MATRLTEKELMRVKTLLATQESLYTVSPSLFDPIVDAAEVVDFAKGAVIMAPGSRIEHVYILTDGLVGATYSSGSKTIMHGLAEPGTLLLHGGSFFGRGPSYVQWEAVVGSRTLRVADAVVRDYLHANHEFAIWMYGMAENNLRFAEERTFILSDSAEKRYLKLERDLPRRVFRELSSRVVARYLGITEQSLARIKRNLLQNHPSD